jgi:hypothetical protein
MTSHCFAHRQLCGGTEHLLAATAAACSNFAAIEFVDCPMHGECEVCIFPKRQMRAFGLVRGGAKEALSAAGRPANPVMTDKTRNEHKESAFGLIATKEPYRLLPRASPA